MKFINPFARKADPGKKLADLQNLINRILYQLNNGQAYTPPDKIESYVDDGYKSSVHVYSVITAITQRCTGIPFKHMAGDKEVANSQLIQLLDRPNPSQSRDEFITAAASWLLITGNVYLYEITPTAGLNKGKPTEIWLLPSHLVTIVGGGFMDPIKEYKINIGMGYSLPIPAEQVKHIKYFNPDYTQSGSQLYGQSPLTAALLSLGSNNSAYRALSKSYVNGSPAGILTGTENTGLEYNEAQLIELQNRWTREVGGDENFRKIMFHRSPLQWINMGWSPVDMNILEHLKYSLQDICNIYHAPIHLFNAAAATLDNYKEARKAIYTDCVFPFFDMLIPVFNEWLCDRYVTGSRLEYDTSMISELSADMQKLVTALAQAWWMTGNEKRTAMEMPESPDGMMNEILYPSGSVMGTDLNLPGDPNDFTL